LSSESQALPEVTIRRAKGDDDIAAIHRFLCLVAHPAVRARAPIDPIKSVREIKRVVDTQWAVIAEINGELVGSLGLIKVDWWYANAEFLTERWLFTYPALWHRGVGPALLGYAGAVGTATGLKVIINGHVRMRGTRSDRCGIWFSKPVLIAPGADEADIAAASAAVLQ
jgi:GNAT superfamily N-acetyltransferase